MARPSIISNASRNSPARNYPIFGRHTPSSRRSDRGIRGPELVQGHRPTTWRLGLLWFVRLLLSLFFLLLIPSATWDSEKAQEQGARARTAAFPDWIPPRAPR